MTLKEVLGVQELKKAVSVLKKDTKKLFYIVLFDLLFFFFYGFFVQTFLNKMLEYVLAMSVFFSQESADVTRASLQKGLLSFVSETPEFAKLFYGFLWAAFLAIISLYIIYVLFQGLSWRTAKVDKISIYEYIKAFALINIPWFIIFLVIQMASFLTLYLAMVSETLQIYFPFNAYNGVIIGALIVLVYFAVISYGLIGNQRILVMRTLYLGIVKVFSIIPKYLLIIVMYIVIFKALDYVLLFNKPLMIGLGVIIVMPAIALTKVYTNLVIKKEGG